VSLTLATEGLFEPFNVPPLEELFEFQPFLFDGTPFAFNRVALLTLLAAGLAAALFLVAFNSPKVVPGKVQAVAESIVEFIKDQVAIQVIGPEGVQWVPFLTTLFMFVWINNLFEIVPLINFPPTSRMALPAFLALMVWAMFIIVGMKAQGPIRYLREVAFPPGVPIPIYILVTPIEIVSTFLVRPLTLAVRLFANLLAGHIILTIIFLAVNAFIISARGFPIGIVALAAAPLLVGFELLVGVLQAYIFTILAAVYIGGALHPEH
jgi:F-type H+-transporting ATPase subunit a